MQQHLAAPTAPVSAFAAAPLESAAAGTTVLETYGSRCHGMTLSGLQECLQGCGCEQGLTVLWDLAEVLSKPDTQAEVAAAATAAAEMSAQQMLQFLTNPQLLHTFQKQLQQCADEQGDECRRTLQCLHGLQQLLAQPVVAAVLGWDSERQQQQLAEVRSLCSMWETASGQQQQQQHQHQLQQQPPLAPGISSPEQAPSQQRQGPQQGDVHQEALGPPCAPSHNATTHSPVGFPAQQQQQQQPQQQQQLEEQEQPCMQVSSLGRVIADSAQRVPPGQPATAAQVAPAPTIQLQAATPSTLIVDEIVSSKMAAAAKPLRSALRMWVQACGITGEPGIVPVAELLPHYAKFLAHLDSRTHAAQLAPRTAYFYVSSVRSCLLTHQQALEGGSVDYAAMLNSLATARSKYHQSAKMQRQMSHSLSGRKRTSDASDGETAVTAPARVHKPTTHDAAGTAVSAGLAESAAPRPVTAEAAALASAGVVAGITSSSGVLQQLQQPPQQQDSARIRAGQSPTPPQAWILLVRQRPQQQWQQLKLQPQQPQQPQPQRQPATADLAAISATANGRRPDQNISWAQLHQQLSRRGSNDNGWGVVWHLAQHTPGITQDSAVAPVLLTYTSPELLAGCNKKAAAGGIHERRAIINTLRGLQQLLQQPELDAVLGAAVKQQRLADVSFVLLEVQATALQAGSSSWEGVGHLRGTEPLRDDQAQQGACQGRQQLPTLPSALAAGAAAAAAGAAAGAGAGAAAAAAAATAGAAEAAEAAAATAGTGAAAAASFASQRLLATSTSAYGMSRQLQSEADSSSRLAAGVPGPTAAAAAAAAVVTAGGTLGTAAAAALVHCTGMSMADMLQQLPLFPVLGDVCVGACIKQLTRGAACFENVSPDTIRAACFEDVSLDTIPASLLLTNYIAEVGERAQQCLSSGAVGQQGTSACTGSMAECMALIQEVKGLLVLSEQPVLQAVLGGQKLQELVEGLLRCKQLLSDTQQHA